MSTSRKTERPWGRGWHWYHFRHVNRHVAVTFYVVPCTTNARTTTLAFCVAHQNVVGVFVGFLVHCFLYPIISNNISRDSHTDCSINSLVQEVFRQNGVQERTADERNHGASETKDFCWTWPAFERSGRWCFGNRDRCGRELRSLSWRNIPHSCWFKPTRWGTSYGKLEESRRESSLEEVYANLSRGYELFIRKTGRGGQLRSCCCLYDGTVFSYWRANDENTCRSEKSLDACKFNNRSCVPTPPPLPQGDPSTMFDTGRLLSCGLNPYHFNTSFWTEEVLLLYRVFSLSHNENITLTR